MLYYMYSLKEGHIMARDIWVISDTHFNHAKIFNKDKTIKIYNNWKIKFILTQFISI